MRFLLLTNEFPNPYEPTKAVFNLGLARALARDHEVRVVSPIPWVKEWRGAAAARQALGTERRLVLDGVEVHYPRYVYPPKLLRGSYHRFYWRSVRQTVWRVLDEGLPDVILSSWLYPDGKVATDLGQVLGVPVAIIVGGSDVLLLPRRGRVRQLAAEALRKADAVLAVSQDLREKTAQLAGAADAADKVHVWQRGIDTGSFAPGDRVEARRRLGIPADRKVLLWVGRMHPVKAVDVLLDSCAGLRRRGVDFHLYLVGDGPLRPALEAQTRAASLSESVSFVGPRAHHELADWYRAADVTVLPSLSEGLPNVLRESLACGTPFVASRVGGIPELADGPANRLVPPGDAGALADALAATLARPEEVEYRPAGWEQAVDSLLGILRPLAEAAHNPERPWWSGRQPATITAETPVSRLRFRQILRSGMAALLPRRLYLVRGPASSGEVCLTFDDGPHPERTPRLLDVLKDYGVRATFFVVGRQAAQYPDLVRRIAEEGHEIGNHSFLHADIRLLSGGEAARGIQRTQDLLRRLVGEAPTAYRPPRGKLTAGLALRLWRAGLAVVLWNVDPRDYSSPSAAHMAAWFRKHPLCGGDVVLFHDRLPHAAAVLPGLIEATWARGLEFTTASRWTRGEPAGAGLRPRGEEVILISDERECHHAAAGRSTHDPVLR